MNEQELGKEIAKLLDSSADEHIKQSTLYRLQSARRAALESYQPTMRVMNSGNGTSIYGGHDGHFNAGKLFLLLTLIVLFALVCMAYWQSLDNDRYSALDTMILADDLPIDAYIDNEFDEWLDSE